MQNETHTSHRIDSAARLFLPGGCTEGISFFIAPPAGSGTKKIVQPGHHHQYGMGGYMRRAGGNRVLCAVQQHAAKAGAHNSHPHIIHLLVFIFKKFQAGADADAIGMARILPGIQGGR